MGSSEAVALAYIDLVQHCLCDYIYPDVSELNTYNQHQKWFGRYLPTKAHAMTGMARLNNLRELVRRVLDDNIPGDFIECGVWRGGAAIFMRALLKAYDNRDKVVWVADSFQGLPKPDQEKYPKDTYTIELWNDSRLSVSLDEVKRNFQLYQLLDSQVVYYPGFFEDTMPEAPMEKLSILRIDADMYGSTWVCLENLYPRLAVGGYCIVDDYHALRQATRATDDYREQHGIEEELFECEPTAPQHLNESGWGIYWRKENE